MERGGGKNECDLVSVDSVQGSEPDVMAWLSEVGRRLWQRDLRRGQAPSPADRSAVDPRRRRACRPDGLIEHHFVEARDLPRPLPVSRALAAWTEYRKSRTIRTRDQAAFWLGYRPTASFYSAWADSRET